MPYGTHAYIFNPFSFTAPDDVEYLSGLLNDQGVIARFPLVAHRRRGAWGTTVPVGVFDNNFKVDACSWEQHSASRNRITTQARIEEPGNRRPIARSHDVLQLENTLYYHPEALRVYARYVAHGAFLQALARFLDAAEKNHALIVPPRPRAAFIPHEQRVARFGRPTRGPDWTPNEDLVIRRWFGQRTVGPAAGRHVALSEAEWATVLRELPQRNKKSVHDRIITLNNLLKLEFFRDGFVALDRLPDYMKRVLGERPRAPIRPKRRRRA